MMRRIRKWWRRLLFSFKRPRYQKGDRVILWSQLFELPAAQRNWKYCHFTYQIDEVFRVSEGLVDFYNNN